MNNYTNPVTVTGNPASFEASGNGKILSLSVPFSPTQDLHGYANPWPAGGGENILPMPITSGSYANSVTVDVNPDLSFVINKPSSSGWTVFQLGSFLLAAGTYTLIEADDGNQNASISILREDSTEITNTRYVKRRVFTLTSSETVKATYSRAAAATDVLTKIMLFAGDTKTADDYAPYSNICPISGRTGLSVYVSPTQDPDDATVYNVDWTTQAGTVYGGTLDVVTGVLTVDKAVCTENDFTMVSSGISAGGLHWADFNTTNITTNGTSLCSILGIRADGNAGLASTVPCYALTEGVRVRVYCKEGTLADFQSKYAGLQICYPLATPLTYQLTPKQIALLLGQNNVWSDSNEAVTLTYIIELFTRYTFIVNGNDYTGLVERDSYRTTLYPVFGETVQTLDGVGHTAMLRQKGELSLRLNQQTAATVAAMCSDILNAPCEVQYHCLQRNADVTALMTIDSVSAMFLSRCLYCGQKWNDIDSITLTEL